MGLIADLSVLKEAVGKHIVELLICNFVIKVLFVTDINDPPLLW